MSQEQQIAAGDSAPVGGRSSFIVCVLVMVMLLDFVSFGAFWMGRAVTSGDWTRMDQNLRSAVWPEFLVEAEYYAKQDMPTVNVALDKYLSLDRQSFGNGGPFVDYFFQKVFRAIGFFTCFLGGFIAVLFLVVEGYRRNKEKRQNFEKLSSTVYHFTLYAGGLFAVCFFLLYLFMPSRVFIPGLLEAQVPLLLYNPFFWASVMTLVAGLTVYGMVSNITNA